MDTPAIDNLGPISERLKLLRSLGRAGEGTSTQRNATAPLTQYPGVIPTDAYQHTAIASDPLEEQIQAYLAKPYVIGEISQKFAQLGNVTKEMRPVKHDFPDDSLLNKAGITMERASPEDIVRVGRAVIPMISSGFSRRGAATLFMLAYNTKTPGGEHSEDLFPDVDEYTTCMDKHYEEFSDNVMVLTGTAESIVGGTNPENEAATYAYIATSMMRLFTKSSSNYVRAWNHILSGYRKFYGRDVEVQLPSPNETAIQSLADWFAIEPKAKNTLYRLLYLGNSSEDHKGFKRFLYEIHLANTGMHLASMFVHLCGILNCSTGILLQAINVKEYERQVDCLVALIKILCSNEEKYKRKMWKYGRIFDESFMADIQTKACPTLVYIFAEALREEKPNTYGNVLQIAQLADVSESKKRKCKAVASKLVQAIRAHTNVRSEGGGLMEGLM